MVKLKVSYETIDELAKVITLLGSTARDVKLKQTQSGMYKRAYIELIDLKKVEILGDDS